ncbi:hypothetical protein [Helicobacter rodentium]|uniref:hypothetical protein n=1 Tax=Helicobacter rodentium TaxID=59617 RepID=UPI002557F75C|nr:hypothetical protein [Helicobacter rodentium]
MRNLHLFILFSIRKLSFLGNLLSMPTLTFYDFVLAGFCIVENRDSTLSLRGMNKVGDEAIYNVAQRNIYHFVLARFCVCEIVVCICVGKFTRFSANL